MRKPGAEDKMSRRKENGFTLIEVVIACAIFAMGIMGIYGLTAWIQRANDFSNKMTSATAIAQANLEQVMANSFSAIADGSAADGLFNTTWTVTSLNADLKSILLTTSWNDVDGRSHEVVLRTLVSQ